MLASGGRSFTFWSGASAAIAGGIGLGLTIWASRLPRVAYAPSGSLLLFLRGAKPIRIPIEIVECFFLGQGPSGVRHGQDEEDLEARNIVVRLAEKATEWQHGDVDRRLGNWCGGYITINGTWCEPINTEVVGLMNHDLAEVKRQRRRDEESNSIPAGQRG
jgi:hypothetical protein